VVLLLFSPNTLTDTSTMAAKQRALAAKYLGSKAPWQQSALAAKRLGSKAPWQQSALAAKRLGSKAPWPQNINV
jgi:hypothetical protein